MSINVSIRLPLHTAAAIQNGDYDKIQLSRYVVDAVQALPLRLTTAAIRPEEVKDASTSDDTEDFTPPASIFSVDDAESLTLIDGESTTRAPSLAPTLRTNRAPSPSPSVATLRTAMSKYQPANDDPPMYRPPENAPDPLIALPVTDGKPAIMSPDVNFKEKSMAILIDQGAKGTWPLPVKNTMTVGDLMVEIEHRTSIPIAQQRLKLTNGTMLEFGRTLEAFGIKPGWRIVLTPLLGVCFPDSMLDFWVHITPGSSVPETRFPVHARPTTTAKDLSLALFASHHVPVRQQRLFLGSELVLFDGSGSRSGSATMETLGIYSGATVRLRMVIIEPDEIPAREQRRFQWPAQAV